MGIYSKIIDLQKLGMAWDHVMKNKPAAGVDNVTWEDFENRRKEELRQLNLELAEHRYESLPVRQVQLYKGEKVRTIALFSMRDKVVQQSVAAELGKIYEPLFSKCSYAYRPGQSALQALEHIEGRIKMINAIPVDEQTVNVQAVNSQTVSPQSEGSLSARPLWVLKMDIANFFDEIRHEILLQKLGQKLREEDVIDLVRIILKTAVLDEKTGDLKANHVGIIQGASSAPILSNIYLMDYDREMEHRSSFYIRYSDDILVLEEDEQKAKELYEFSRLYMENLGLKLKEAKTELHVLTKENGFEYLGYAFNSEGKSIPQKALDSLSSRMETTWITTELPFEVKLKKCQEIVDGWEQYFRGERQIGSIIEFVTILSMVRNKSHEVLSEIERKRFTVWNYYKDILNYLVDYWMESGRINCAIWEYEQFFQVGLETNTLLEIQQDKSVPCSNEHGIEKQSNERQKNTEKNSTEKNNINPPVMYTDEKLCMELLENYKKLVIRPDEELYAEMIQIYTDLGEYQKASFFWDEQQRLTSSASTLIPMLPYSDKGDNYGDDERNHSNSDYGDAGQNNAYSENFDRNCQQLNVEKLKINLENINIDINEYMALFVGREDTYVSETLQNGSRRISEQLLEPLTEEKIRRHLAAQEILGTYVQRSNNTAKYLVFDLDISKKILLQYPYGTEEFSRYKQIAAERTLQLCKLLKGMGIRSYIEDTGFRGYHVWIFFTEWIPVRYINQLTEIIQREMAKLPLIHGEDGDIVIESFPNNIRIRPGKCGPCIKLPLGIHIRTGERSYFLDEQMLPIQNYKEFFSGIAKVSLNAVRKILGLYMGAATGMISKNVAMTSSGKGAAIGKGATIGDGAAIGTKTNVESGTKTEDVDEPIINSGRNKGGLNSDNIELDMNAFGAISDSIKIVLEGCNLMRFLCHKAQATGYLSHFERQSILYVFGHMGESGKEFVHTVMSFTMNYQYNVTQKFIMKIPDKPISCLKLREQYKMVTAEIGCSCSFKRTKNCYPSPVLHALKNSGDMDSEITIPTSRTISKEKEEVVYEELNIHKQAEKLAQRIIELKKQKNGLDRSIRKIEREMQSIFDNAGIDCLEINIGMLVRRKKGEGYEWLIEI